LDDRAILMAYFNSAWKNSTKHRLVIKG